MSTRKPDDQVLFEFGAMQPRTWKWRDMVFQEFDYQRYQMLHYLLSILDSVECVYCASLLVSVDDELVADLQERIRIAREFNRLPVTILTKLAATLFELYPPPGYEDILANLDVDRLRPLGYMTEPPTKNYFTARVLSILTESCRANEMTRLEQALGTLWTVDDFLHDLKAPDPDAPPPEQLRVPIATILNPKLRDAVKGQMHGAIGRRLEEEEMEAQFSEDKAAAMAGEKFPIRELQKRAEQRARSEAGSHKRRHRIHRKRSQVVELWDTTPAEFIQWIRGVEAAKPMETPQQEISTEIEGVTAMDKDNIGRGL